MRLKVIIDTNVAISGLLWKGLPNDILKLARDGFIEICSTKTIFEELVRVLGYNRFQKRFKELGLSIEDIVDYYEDIVGFYSENSKVDIIKTDDSDNRFIEAAIDSGSSIIITGDEHLLKIKEYRNIMILNPREFLEVYRRLS